MPPTIAKTYSAAGTYTAVATARDGRKNNGFRPGAFVVIQSTSTLTVETVNAAGNPINGYYTTLSQNGAIVKTGYTPLKYTAETRSTYEISIASYGDYFFDHWDNGSKSKSRTVTPSGNTVFTAYSRQ